MNFGSLFSGIGGFDRGFERAGHECVWQVEIDGSCQRVLRSRFGEAGADKLQRVGGQPGGNQLHPRRDERTSHNLHADVATGGRRNLAAVDLICGGFPCQDLSVAGKRAGLDGERSGLWFQFHRILAELRPRWVVIENVPGLLSSNGGADMAVVLGGLAQLGYGWAYRVLDAQHFGVAQRRRRVFIVGHLGEPWSAPAAVLFEPESCGGNPPGRQEAGQRVAGGLAASAGSGGLGGIGQSSNSITSRIVEVAGTLGGGSGERGWPQDTERMTFMPVGPGDGDFIPEVSYALSARASMDRPESGAVSLLAASAAVRRLTPTECERLQGFPDGWTDGQSDSTRYRQLGNAVCVPVAEWIGRRLVGVDA